MEALHDKELESGQYSLASIKRYEAIFGDDFVSPGGLDMAVELIGGLGLAPGARVLDAGCGLGGSAFVMARDFGFRVDGIDLSGRMIEMANRKLESHGLRGRVSLVQGDCLELDVSRPVYDAVYSRDVFLHIHDKPRLFNRLGRVLRSGGKLLFTDYCCGSEPWSVAFSAYVEERGYCLHTISGYAGIISDAGFRDVETNDMTDRFLQILKRERNRIPRLGFSAAEKEEMTRSWESKIERVRSGNHRWGLFTAAAGS